MRNLWKQLGNPHGRFDKWMERKVLPSGFDGNIDFEVYDDLKRIEPDFQKWPIIPPMDKNAHRVKKPTKSTVCDDSIRDTPYGYVDIHTFAHKYYERRPKVDYRFTVDAAKHVCLSENTDIGKAFRQYFIMIEKAFREHINFESVREPEKQGYVQLMESLARVYSPCSDKRKQQEANMLNRALMGLSAEEIRQRLEITDVWTRDHLQKRYNEVLDRLQQFDRALIESGVEYKDR